VAGLNDEYDEQEMDRVEDDVDMTKIMQDKTEAEI